MNKNPYELITKRKFKLSYFKLFGCKFYVLNNEKNGLEKFDPRSDDGVFVGYSSTIKAYKIYNKRTQCVEKSIHVMFDDASGTTGGSTPDDDNSGNPLNVPKKFDEGDDDGDSQVLGSGPKDENLTDPVLVYHKLLIKNRILSPVKKIISFLG